MTLLIFNFPFISPFFLIKQWNNQSIRVITLLHTAKTKFEKLSKYDVFYYNFVYYQLKLYSDKLFKYILKQI